MDVQPRLGSSWPFSMSMRGKKKCSLFIKVASLWDISLDLPGAIFATIQEDSGQASNLHRVNEAEPRNEERWILMTLFEHKDP